MNEVWVHGCGDRTGRCAYKYTFVYKAIYRNLNNGYLKGEREQMPLYPSCTWEYTAVEENQDSLLYSDAVF